MKKNLLISLLLLSSFSAFSQEVVEFTIGGDDPNYSTINDAAAGFLNNDFYDGTVVDTVIYNLREGLYNEQVFFDGTNSFDVVVVFQPEFEDDEVVIEFESDGLNANFLIGDIYSIIFKNITFRNSSSQETEGILKISQDTEYFPPELEIYNCRFESDLENILQEKPLVARNPYYHGLVVRNCYFEGGNVAIDLTRINHPHNSQLIEIFNNQFDSVYTAAVRAEECESLRFESNTINWSYTDGVKSTNSKSISVIDNEINARNAVNCLFIKDSAIVEGNEITGFGNGFGLQASAGQTGFEPTVRVQENSFITCGEGVSISDFEQVRVSENKFLNEEGEGASAISIEECLNGFVFINANEIVGSSGLYGIHLNLINGLNSPIGGNHRLTNNMITGFQRAIFMETAEDVDLLFNSISCYGESENALALQNTFDIRLMNNAVKHYGEGSQTLGEVIFTDQNLNFESNHNVFDFDPESTVFSSDYETLEDAQLAGLDQNSIQASINYFDDQMDLKTCGQNLFQQGTSLIEVAQDIFGFDRASSQPTVGAQEIFSSDAEPVADFEIDINEFTITTENNTVHGGDYLWDFGDGNTSDAFEPVHTYQQMSNFAVTLNVQSPCGADNHTILIVVPGVLEHENKVDFTVYPNPTKGSLNLESDENLLNSKIRVFDLNGREVFVGEVKNRMINLATLESGTYILMVEKQNGQVGSRQFIIH